MISGSPALSNPIPESVQAAIRRHVEGLREVQVICEENTPKESTVSAFSSQYKDSQVTLSEDRYKATGGKEWASVLVANGASTGDWWYEIQITNLEDSAAVRPGWSLRYTRYDAPIGIDMFSVSLRDRDLSVVYGAMRHSYGYNSLKTGDIVGCGISLGDKSPEPIADPRLRPELHQYVQAGLLCNPNRPPTTRKNQASSVCFMINGQVLPNILEGKLPAGFWHPGVALYNGASVKLNPGPQFNFPPPAGYRPACEMSSPPF